jgi:AbrB family looped-hinge helix DNA binding protein
MASTPSQPPHNPSRSSRVSPKGQVTVPKPVRDLLGLYPGTSVEFELTGEGTVVLRKRPDSARSLRGILSAYAPDSALTVEEIDDALGREVAHLNAVSRSGAEDGANEKPGRDDA